MRLRTANPTVAAIETKKYERVPSKDEDLKLYGTIELTCPRTSKPLLETSQGLSNGGPEAYVVVNGIPVLLRDDVAITHPYISETLASVQRGSRERQRDDRLGIDSFVQQEIVRTNGYLYQSALNGLNRYPVPRFPLKDGGGRLLLDVGCNWGRWTIAAAKAGFRPVGIGPSLVAVQAAQRVSRQIGVTTQFVVGDARHLPFANESFDIVFSYSVLQHFSVEDAKLAFAEAARVTKKGGLVRIQMANMFGARQLWQQGRDLINREQGLFRVRRWTPWHLLSAGRAAIGPSRLSTDGFFSLNAQLSDLDLMPLRFKGVILASAALRKASTVVPGLTYLADSVYLEARKS